MSIRLHKYLAQAGIASRRKAEELISQGRIKVNGSTVTELGVSIDPEVDAVSFEGKKVQIPKGPKVVYALYKPKNCVTTLEDPEGRKTVAEFFPKTSVRLFPVGRLDYNAEGLLLLTNDGEFANLMSHPSKHVWKEYFVKLKGQIPPEKIALLQKGPMIDGRKRQPVKIRPLHFIHDKTWLAVSLQEGIKHHIKKMFSKVGFPVLKIKRFRIGNVTLEEMNPGDYRKLTEEEIDELVQLAKNR